jgi:hypothetical protein
VIYINKSPSKESALVNSHKEFVNLAANDPTKTDTAKELLVYQDANKRANTITANIDGAYQAAFGRAAELENKVEGRMTIQGTTDFLILQNQAQVLQRMKLSNVMALVEAGDVNTLRALQLPVIQHQFKFNTAEEKERFTQIKERGLLDVAEHSSLEQSRAAVEALTEMGDGLVQQIGASGQAINNIKANVVESAA